MLQVNYILFLMIAFQDEKVSDYTRLFTNIYNPFYISILILLILFVLIYTSYRHVYNPILRKRKAEQEQFEVNTSKLLALFAELDPNPILRIDLFGEIKGMNKSAKKIFNSIKLNETKLKSVLPEIDVNIRALIKEDKSLVIPLKFNNRFYDININGISFLDMAQLYFWDITSKKEYDEQMTHYQLLLRNASVNLQYGVEEERKRLSEILHNSIAQNLLLIKLNVGNYKKYVKQGLNELEFQRTMEILDSTLEEIRSLTHDLKPMNLDQLGLFTVLKSTCYNVAKESGLGYEIQTPDKPLDLDRDLELCIYRVVQETLNNILRHAKANSFNLNLSIENNTLGLYISDDGIGFNPKKLINGKYVSDGMGLMSMQESVERLGGTFQIDSSESGGTVVMATFLIQQKIDVKPGYQNISG